MFFWVRRIGSGPVIAIEVGGWKDSLLFTYLSEFFNWNVVDLNVVLVSGVQQSEYDREILGQIPFLYTLLHDSTVPCVHSRYLLFILYWVGWPMLLLNWSEFGVRKNFWVMGSGFQTELLSFSVFISFLFKVESLCPHQTAFVRVKWRADVKF